MIFFLYSLSLLFLALLPVGMFLANLRHFRTATEDDTLLADAMREKVSVLIPARNEGSSIGAVIDRILENRSIDFELVILDDQSEDNTAAIVRDRMQRSTKIRLIDSIALPMGWNGKQHACWRLAEAARFDWMLFLDADVQLNEHAIQRVIAEGLRTGVALISGFPYQQTETLAEQMLIPLMHFILLGYLPIHRSRTSTSPSLSAGCGQIILARRNAYFECDGHRAIQGSRHDGIQLPRAFRRHGFATDIFDASDIASCRMYRNRREVVLGLMKNANEGIANGRLIVVFTILLAGAALLPIPSLILAYGTEQSRSSIAALTIACLCVFIPRMIAAKKFRQSWKGAFLHPIGIAWFLGLQWFAWFRNLLGQTVAWRGRNS